MMELCIKNDEHNANVQIAALAAESVRGGAFGVSCIRNRAHRDKQGNPPPGNYADWREPTTKIPTSNCQAHLQGMVSAEVA